MKKMNIIITALLIIAGSVLRLNAQQGPKFLTVAEKSGFKSTSAHSDVLDFVKQLKKSSPYVKVETIAKSVEGKEIPLLIIANPLPKDPASLKNDKRVVVYYKANIHAGEVEGKEAVLMLARDILAKQKPDYLDKVILLICPNYNPDGNDKFAPIEVNRRGQNGPDNGTGIRYNGQNLDLNRDAMKAEAPETEGFIKNILNRWDPDIVVDCHTTNGSLYEEAVSFCWAMNPNGSYEVRKYMENKFFPVVSKTLKEKYATPNVAYGEYIDRRDITKGWAAFSQEPRYVVNYAGLRNRLSILNENNVYADFKSRVLGCYNLLKSILDFAYENRDEIVKLVNDADSKTIARGLNPAPSDSFAIEYKLGFIPHKIQIHSYDKLETYKDELGRTRQRRAGDPKLVELPYMADFSAKKSVRVPFGYLITTRDPLAIALLNKHGIEYKMLKDSVTLPVESFKISDLKPAQRSNQGHYTNQVKGEMVKANKKFNAGTIFVPMAQKNANVAAYLLEAQADDGMLFWNFFDRQVVSQWGRGYDYPVHRLIENPAPAFGKKFPLDTYK